MSQDTLISLITKPSKPESDWDVVYESAIRKDGSLFFPERLTAEFLEKTRRVMGSYLFANQYLNEIIPDDEKRFKAHWLKYYKELPINVHHFAFIDPAIGQKKHHDYTGVAVVAVDSDGNWYLRMAKRLRLTPTEIVDLMFNLTHEFQLKGLGVEIVAYQEALLYLVDQEMKRRQKTLPVKDVRRSSQSKEVRILGLVPRFEWGRIFLSQGLIDFEDEYSTFPRGRFDDILDALASLEELVFYPRKQENKIEQPHDPNHPNYERWYIQNLVQKSNQAREHDDA
jgi:predicted phage terminase large subunit-like protein